MKATMLTLLIARSTVVTIAMRKRAGTRQIWQKGKTDLKKNVADVKKDDKNIHAGKKDLANDVEDYKRERS